MNAGEKSILRLAESYDVIWPFNGQCGLCGHPDQRHRLADAMTERWQAGEDLDDIAEDFGVNAVGLLAEFKVLTVVAASLAWQVEQRRSRLSRVEVAICEESYWPAVKAAS